MAATMYALQSLASEMGLNADITGIYLNTSKGVPVSTAKVSFQGKTYIGRGRHNDLDFAFLKAHINAYNRIIRHNGLTYD